MRDTTIGPDDLAIEAAKQKLALIRERPGYLEATRAAPPSNTRYFVLGGGVASLALAYACWAYVTAVWLTVLLMVIFGALGVLLLFASIGFAQKVDFWGAAVVDKRVAGDKHRIVFLAETGEQREIDVSEAIYDVLKPGDLGVVRSTGKDKWISVEAFERL